MCETSSDGPHHNVIACPWCGESFGDLGEFDFGINECLETECGYCERPIVLIMHRSVCYTCKKLTGAPPMSTGT